MTRTRVILYNIIIMLPRPPIGRRPKHPLDSLIYDLWLSLDAQRMSTRGMEERAAARARQIWRPPRARIRSHYSATARIKAGMQRSARLIQEIERLERLRADPLFR